MEISSWRMWKAWLWRGRRRCARLGAALLALLLTQAVAFADAAGGWVWPVRGRVITSYANDNARPYAGGMHRGIDIAAPVGEPVVAAHTGEVTYAAPLGSAGLTVAVRASDGRHVTSYLHLSRIATSRGASLSAGERIGEVGTSGRRSAAEPHLHFGVRLADAEHVYVDPLTLLPPLAARPGDGSAPPLGAPAPVPARQAPLPVGVRPAPATAPPPGARRSPALRPLPALRPAPVRRPLPAVRPPTAAPSPAHPERAHGLRRGQPAAAASPGARRHAPERQAATAGGAKIEGRVGVGAGTAARSPSSDPLGAQAAPRGDERAAGARSIRTAGNAPGSGMDWSKVLLALGAALVLAAIPARAARRGVGEVLYAGSALAGRALAGGALARSVLAGRTRLLSALARRISASRSSRSRIRARAAGPLACGRSASSVPRALP